MKNQLVHLVVLVFVAFVGVFTNSYTASAQSSDVPVWAPLPNETGEEVSVSSVVHEVIFSQFPQETEVHPGDTFTQTVSVKAATDHEQVKIVFGFWNTPIAAAFYLTARTSNGICAMSPSDDPYPHYDCFSRDLAAGETATFTFEMRAISFGDAKTYMGVEISHLDNQVIPPLLYNNSVPWTITQRPISVKLEADAYNIRTNSFVDVYLNVSDVYTGFRSLGGELCFNHNDLLLQTAYEAVDVFEDFQYHDMAECVKFGGYHTTLPIEQGGPILVFQFRVRGSAGTAVEFTLQELEVGENLTFKVQNLIEVIQPSHYLGGRVETVTGNGVSNISLIRRVEGRMGEFSVTDENGNFFIEDAAPGPQSLYFVPMHEYGVVNVTDLGWAFSCFLDRFQDETYCSLLANDVNEDGELTMLDIFYIASYLVGKHEPGIFVGYRTFDPSEMHLDVDRSIFDLLVKTTVKGDATSAKDYVSAASSGQPQVEITQQGDRAIITITAGHKFNAALVQIDGAQVISGESGDKTVIINDNKVVIYGDANSELVINLQVDGQITVTDIQVSEPLPLSQPDIPQQLKELFLPLTVR